MVVDGAVVLWMTGLCSVGVDSFLDGSGVCDGVQGTLSDGDGISS